MNDDDAKLKELLDATLAEVKAMVERDPSSECRQRVWQYAFTEPARKTATLEEMN